MEKDNKTIQLHIRIDQDTMNVLKKKSECCGLTQSSFVRYAIHRMSISLEQYSGKSEEGIPETITDEITNQPLLRQIEANVTLFRGVLAEMGKIGGNLNQAVRNMNVSLKSGANSISKHDAWLVKTCSEQVSDCIKGVWTGLKNLKQIVKKL
jgi:hypothetical protein